jgi:hypothetical protein
MTTLGHRWSGWPGAWCLDCGCEDPLEQALADGKGPVDDNGEVSLDLACQPCPEPGSKRHDPYAKRNPGSND